MSTEDKRKETLLSKVEEIFCVRGDGCKRRLQWYSESQPGALAVCLGRVMGTKVYPTSEATVS